MDISNLSFDLREIYSRICAIALTDAISKLNDFNYPEAYSAFKMLYGLVSHKIKETPEDNFQKLEQDFVKKSNEFRQAYRGESQDPKAQHEIKFSLIAIQKFLLTKMSEAGMFGEKQNKELPI